MKLRLVPMTAEHYLEAASPAYPWIGRERAEALARTGPAWAGFWDDLLLGVAGVSILWPGVGEAWAILTAAGRQHPLIVHRAIVRQLAGIIREHGLRRLQADVIEEFTAGQQWVERLGLIQESVMPQYGPEGQTMVRYRRFFS